MLKELKWKIVKSNSILNEFFNTCENPYIAFSTGKDSSVCLDLALKIKPDIPIVYFDADAKTPDTAEMLDYFTNQSYNVIRYKTEPLLETLKKYGFNHPKIETYTMKSTVYEPIKKLLKEYNFDGVILGLREEENHGRKMMLRKHGSLFFQKRDCVYECNPISKWTSTEVWDYIDSNKIKYNKEYDNTLFLPREKIRVSYCYGETFRTCGRVVFLKHYYPELFNRFLKEIPEIRNYV
jgi:phosphoadenosine phosphosulfate reductase